MDSLLPSKKQKSMKKKVFILSAIAVTAAALASCNKEQAIQIDVEPQGTPFEIVAGTVDTKTVNSDMSTTWQSTDKINLFHAVHDVATYNHDGQYSATAAGASVTFSGTLKSGTEPTSENTYDWFALYPYNLGYTAPAGTKYISIPAAQYQSGSNSMSHLSGSNCPLAGNVKGVAYDATPSITMKNVTSVVKVVVKNKTAGKIVVSKVTFTTSNEKINGNQNLNITGDTPVFSGTNGSTTSVLYVDSDTAKDNEESSAYYISIKPFTALAGSSITLSVTTNNGTQEVSSGALAADFTFHPGKIHALNFNYTKVTPDAISTESEPLVVGFESSEGFSAATNYSRTYTQFKGAAAQQWGILSGDVTTTAALIITGSQSLSLWDYTANAFAPEAYTDYRLSSVKEVQFKAFASDASYKVKLSYSTDNKVTWTDAETFTLTTSAASYKHTFAEVKNNVALKFTVVQPTTRIDKAKVNIDDVSFSKTALTPNVSVTTTAATNTASALGTTATLNGTFDLVNGAVIGSLTEVGFEYKVNAAGDYTTQAVTPKPDAAGAYSLNVTGLTKDVEYTYHAYGIYDGGAKVTSADQTFTPIQATTATINFGSASGSTKIEGSESDGTGTVTYTDTGNDSQGNEWTITTVTSNAKSFTQKSTYSQVGASDKGVSSITLTTTLPASKDILAMSAKVGGFSGTAGTVSLNVGSTQIGSGSLDAGNDVIVSSTSTASGTVLTVTITPSANKGVKVYYVSVTYK